MKSRNPLICLSSSSIIIVLFYTFVIILTTFATICTSDGGNETDHMALLSFKSMLIQDDPYGVLASWNNSFHFCDWIGVSCGKRHKRVTAIKLNSQGLQGWLSPHVGNLSFLRELSLGNNNFQGNIPHELARLSRLRILSLEENKFDGIIPTNLSSCSNLQQLSLGKNKLVGSVPNEFGNFLSKLTIFTINDNNLTGGFPSSLGNLTLLESFSIANNPIRGSIPDTLGLWKSLRRLDAGTCQLVGSIPNSIYNLSLLTNLTLPANNLTGSLPIEFGTMLPNLQFLRIGSNQLSGLLPRSIANCSRLKYLSMSNNDFSGKLLRINFANLKDIMYITMYNNKYPIHGEADIENIINSLTNCSRLRMLDLGDCNFQAKLPMSIGNFSNELVNLYLGENELSGDLPSSIGNLGGLSYLALGVNRFTGKIPSTIGMLTNLQNVYLYYNKFSGSIPDEIGNLSMLINFVAFSNALEGEIPSSMGNCYQLQGLELENNELIGEIPKRLLQLTSLYLLFVFNNSLSGSLPIEIGNLKMLNYFDVSNNNFSGKIPSSLGSCSSLIHLSLKNNLFQGMIPSSLSSLGGLELLDLSQNNLSGSIPLFLERFSLVNKMNLSYNDFEGRVPILGVFSNQSAFSILGNDRLCGGLGELGLPKCKTSRLKFFLVVSLVPCTLVIILCLVYAWFKLKRKDQSSESSTNEKFLKVSYDQLLKATDGFSEANLVGQGGFSSVYKGTLHGSDEFVAIKVLNLQIRGAEKSFITECEAWRSIRHRNLLKIITSCSSIDFQGNDFKALVYEFMPNGSLHDWLHSSANTSRLDLRQRINILIDVASALDYLHNQCLTTIVHGDLKPSNILLDNDMVAHVGDFGLARFLETNSTQNNSSGFRGTLGYAPPEYGVGSEMTSSGDVYSFGILLLEVMTGKNPTDEIFVESLSLHKFAYMSLSNNVINVIHPDAVVMQSTQENGRKMEECLASTVKIGLSCSMDSQQDRMNMENVVNELQHIMDVLKYLEVN